MADNQAAGDTVDDAVTQGRVSPSLPLSNRSRNHQTQRENRAKNRGSRGRSGLQVLIDAQRDLANARARTSRREHTQPNRSTTTSAASSSPRKHTQRSRYPLPASQHIRTSILASTTTSTASTSHREHTQYSRSPMPTSQHS